VQRAGTEFEKAVTAGQSWPLSASQSFFGSIFALCDFL
jgi:hypothetical protein